MKPQRDLHYTVLELTSYLPSGWALDPGEPEGQYDPKKRRWHTTVYDGLDMSWPLEVKPDDSQRLGRLPALAQAMDGLVRNRLGKPTRGLGLATV